MHDAAVLEVGGFHIDLSVLIPTIVTCIIVFVIARLGVRNLSVTNPGRMQNFMEWVVEFVHNIVAGTMPLHKAKKYVAVGMTFIMFIFIANLLGLPMAVVFEVEEPVEFLGLTLMDQATIDAAHESGKHLAINFWKSPTADISFTMGLALIVFLIIQFQGLTTNTKHYLKHYVEPYPIFLPLNLIEHIARPATLGIRLFANIFAGEILIGVILMAAWGGLPLLAVWQGFSIFIGAIQAFLFTMLTMVYISQAIVHEKH